MAKTDNDYKRDAVIKLIKAWDRYRRIERKLGELGLDCDFEGTLEEHPFSFWGIEAEIWDALEDLSVYARWKAKTDIIGGIKNLDISAEDRADMLLGIKETPEEIIREARP